MMGWRRISAASARTTSSTSCAPRRSSRETWSICSQRAEVLRHLDLAALAKLADPGNYVGLSGEMVDRVLRGVD